MNILPIESWLQLSYIMPVNLFSILVSGDNRHESYNEPRQIRYPFIKAGVDPENHF